MRFQNTALSTNICGLCNKVKESSSNGRWKDVLLHYKLIRKEGAQLRDHTVFSHILKACLTLSDKLGESVHGSLIKEGFNSFNSVRNSLIDYYTKAGDLCLAVRAFNFIKEKDSVSWNIILHGHLDQGFFEEGLDLFIQARACGFEPNVSTLVLVIQSYRNLRDLNGGQIFHGYLIRCGLCGITSLQNSLLGMYTDFVMGCAGNLFDEMEEKDVISWSVMIGGYVHTEEIVSALQLFKQMVSKFKIEADGQAIVSVLKGCIKLDDNIIGKSIHGFVVTRGLNCDLFVGNTLIDFYCKCGDIGSAVVAFHEMPCRNIVSWNSLLSGFVHTEKHSEALALFASIGKSGLAADEVTLVNLLQICKVLGDLHQCKSTHCRVIRIGFHHNDMVMNSLIDAYAKCNQINYSWRLFCKIRTPDIVTWSTMISGFTHCGMPNEAITLYQNMLLSPQNQNPVTLLNLIEACALSAEITRSKWAHGVAIRMGLASDVVVGTAILDMYSKCGAIETSRRVFNQILGKNIVSWSALIGAYGLNGLPHDALALLSEMEAHGLKPNPVTTLSVLTACCHGGLINEGISFFKDLANEHGIELQLEHYSCLVDLLARAGNLDDALEVINSSPISTKLGSSAWGALLSACRNYENRKLMTGALSRILELEPSNSAGYLLASNVYANGGSWTEASGLRQLMKERGVTVMAGYSLVHVNNTAYTFTAGEKNHPLSHVDHPVIEHLHSVMRMEFGSVVIT